MRKIIALIFCASLFACGGFDTLTRTSDDDGDGDQTPLSPPEFEMTTRLIDFGIARLDTVKPRFFPIANRGGADLVIDKIELAPDSDPGFEILADSQAPLIIPGGTERRIHLAFFTSEYGRSKGKIFVEAESVGAVAELELMVTSAWSYGEVLQLCFSVLETPDRAPECKLEREFDFGDVPVGEQRTLKIVAESVGTQTVHFVVDDSANGPSPGTSNMEINFPPGTTLSPGERSEFSVLFKPITPGEKYGEFDLRQHGIVRLTANAI